MHADIHIDDTLIIIDSNDQHVGLSILDAGEGATVILTKEQSELLSDLLRGEAPQHQKRFDNLDYPLHEYYFITPKYKEGDSS